MIITIIMYMNHKYLWQKSSGSAHASAERLACRSGEILWKLAARVITGFLFSQMSTLILRTTSS